jgi:hypothetical protein
MATTHDDQPGACGEIGTDNKGEYVVMPVPVSLFIGGPNRRVLQPAHPTHQRWIFMKTMEACKQVAQEHDDKEISGLVTLPANERNLRSRTVAVSSTAPQVSVQMNVFVRWFCVSECMCTDRGFACMLQCETVLPRCVFNTFMCDYVSELMRKHGKTFVSAYCALTPGIE